jgi:hypothetical protein
MDRTNGQFTHADAALRCRPPGAHARTAPLALALSTPSQCTAQILRGSLQCQYTVTLSLMASRPPQEGDQFVVVVEGLGLLLCGASAQWRQRAPLKLRSSARAHRDCARFSICRQPAREQDCAQAGGFAAQTRLAGCARITLRRCSLSDDAPRSSACAELHAQMKNILSLMFQTRAQKSAQMKKNFP